jgi:tripartite ATP-independent transporter DctP family solute receptor
MSRNAWATKASTSGVTRRRFLSSVAAGTAGMAWLAEKTPPAFAQQRVFAARFGTVIAATNVIAITDKFFCDEANKRSGGAFQIQFFPDAQIGASRDLLEGIQLGTVQFADVSTANITSFLADTMVFDLPYVFTSQPALLKFLDGPVGSQTLAVERFGTIKMRALCWYDTGTRKIYNSRKPIYTPDDLKGMKIRVEENPVRVASLNAMGAQATPMAFSEVYGALQQKVVDGAENSEQTYMTSKHNEVAPFLSITDHFMTPNCIAVGTMFFNSLPKDLQDLLIQVAKDTAAYERKLWAESSVKLMGEMKAAGVKVNDADKKAFQATVTKVHQEYAKRVPKDWWDTVMKAAGL